MKAMSSQIDYYITLSGFLRWESTVGALYAVYNDHVISVILGQYLVEVSKPPTIVVRFYYNIRVDQNIIPNLLRRIDEEDYDMPQV